MAAHRGAAEPASKARRAAEAEDVAAAARNLGNRWDHSWSVLLRPRIETAFHTAATTGTDNSRTRLEPQPGEPEFSQKPILAN